MNWASVALGLVEQFGPIALKLLESVLNKNPSLISDPQTAGQKVVDHLTDGAPNAPELGT